MFFSCDNVHALSKIGRTPGHGKCGIGRTPGHGKCEIGRTPGHGKVQDRALLIEGGGYSKGRDRLTCPAQPGHGGKRRDSPEERVSSAKLT